VLWQALTGDAAAALEAGRRPDGRGQAGGRVQVVGGGEPLDGQAVGGEAGRPDDCHPGQGGQDLAGSRGQQPSALTLGGGDVGLEELMAGKITTQPLGPQLGVSGWGSSRRQRSTQNPAVARVSRPGARACKDRTVGALPAKAAAQASTA